MHARTRPLARLLRPLFFSPATAAALTLMAGGHSLALAQGSPAAADRSPFVRPSDTPVPVDSTKGAPADATNAGQWYGTPNAGLTSAASKAANAGVRAGSAVGGFLSGSGVPASSQLPPPVPGSLGSASATSPQAEPAKDEVKVRYVGEVNGKQLYRAASGSAYFFVKEKRPDFKLQEISLGDAGAPAAQASPAANTGAARASSK